MAFWDRLRRGGRKNLGAREEGLFALLTSLPDLEGQGWSPTGLGAVCVRRGESFEARQAVAEVERLLEVYRRDHPVPAEKRQDGMGFWWWVMGKPGDAAGFADVVTAIHLVADTLRDQGQGDSLLAALFPFREEGEALPLYLVYSYRRGRYYPFAPEGSHRRNHAREIRASSQLPSSLPREEELDRWYPLWDAPLDPPAEAQSHPRG